MSDFKKKAEKWAEDYLKSEEGKLNIERLNDELLEFMTFGRVGYIVGHDGEFRKATQEELMKLEHVVEGVELSASEIIDRYRYKEFLTEEELKELRDDTE